MTSKLDRAATANKMLVAISQHGRRFFYNKQHDRVAHFEVSKRGHIFFVDDYSDRRIYTHHVIDSWRGFSHGGRLRDLVIALRDYITTGQPIGRHFGPWSTWICGDDPWGYGAEAMAKVREAALALGITADPAASSGPLAAAQDGAGDGADDRVDNARDDRLVGSAPLA